MMTNCNMGPVAEKLFNLTLEMICLITGEECTVVKKASGEHVITSSHPHVSGKRSRTQSPMTVPSSRSLIRERKNEQKIMELANKIIQLLTKEEEDYTEENTCLYKNIMTEDHKEFTSLGLPNTAATKKLSAHIKEASSSCDAGDFEDTDNYTPSGPTPYAATHIKEDSNSCDGEDFTHADMYTPTDHTPYIATRIKEGSDSCDEEDYTHTDMYTPTDHTPYITTRIKEEPTSCDGGNITETGMYATTDDAPYTSTYTKEESVSDTESNPDASQFPYIRVKIKDEVEFWETDDPSENTSEQQGPGGSSAQAPYAVDGIYSCTKCPRTFPNNLSLLRHQRAHIEKKFTCTECGKHFLYEFHLSSHQLSHAREKSFPCLTCGKCFDRNSYLLVHQRTHRGDLQLPCPECGKCFSKRSNLKAHMIIHTGEKPFACAECGKRFNMKSNLTSHQVVHSGEKPFCCNICGTIFNRRTSLIVHQRKKVCKKNLKNLIR